MPPIHPVLRWSPNQHPEIWLWINLVCMVAALIVAVNDVRASDETLLKPVAAALYLVYSFVTSLVWCFEVGLIAYEEWRCLRWATKLELLLAAYFLLDSSQLLSEWRLASSDDEIDMNLIEALLSTVGYAYVAWECARTVTLSTDRSRAGLANNPVESEGLQSQGLNRATQNAETPLVVKKLEC